MRRLLLFLLLSSAALAQNFTAVTATNIQKSGAPLASGTICFTATDASDAPIAFRVGGGGQAVVAPYCAAITNGVSAALQVANPANTAPANVSYRVEIFDPYARVLKYAGVQFTGAAFNFDDYVPSANLPLGASANVLSVGSLTITGSCTGCGAGGGSGGYATLQNAGTSLAQRATADFLSGITCADNAGASRSDCQLDQSFSPTWTGVHTFNGNVNLAGGLKINGAAGQGKIPIGDGTNFVPGDPLVQGTQADGSTSTANPIVVGGYDSAGTPAIHRAILLNGAPAGSEYGLVTRNLPSGTQAVSGTVTANAGTGSFTVAQATGSNLHVTCDSGCSSSAGFSDNGTFTTGTTAINPAGGLFDDTPPTAIATGHAASARITPNRALHINLRNQSGTEIGTSASPVQVSLANTAANATALKVDGSTVTQPISGTVTVQQSTAASLKVDLSNTAANTTAIKVDGSGVTQPVSGTVTANAGSGTFNIQSNASINLNQVGGNAVAADSNGRQIGKVYPDTTTASYHTSAKFAASSTTDNFVLPGNASNTVLVTRITLTCTQTTAGQVSVELLKRSTADTSGTSSNTTAVADDSSYAASASVPKSYTGTGPSVGTAVGDLDNAQIGCMAAATATPNDIYIFRPAKPIVLRGTAQQLAINLGGALSGGTITITADWMETTTP
jgi:hypothetical protein